ncbi:hypothetical protein EVAR_74471_1 [Eumeta japonica]|uniref:Uncharacterized protein n=1 Tax=Eumeta variegata TaxID=151549 RepID=A0A4C1TEI7_EUMVA|nr:hypothetical protein EVAR_74471_1 [Eumeta japonica]
MQQDATFWILSRRTERCAILGVSLRANNKRAVELARNTETIFYSSTTSQQSNTCVTLTVHSLGGAPGGRSCISRARRSSRRWAELPPGGTNCFYRKLLSAVRPPAPLRRRGGVPGINFHFSNGNGRNSGMFGHASFPI